MTITKKKEAVYKKSIRFLRNRIRNLTVVALILHLRYDLCFAVL